MGNIPSAGGTTTSFSNTPQAKDDWYCLAEDSLNTATSSYNSGSYILSLDVMANDLGGNAKSLFSIDDAEGNQITDLSKTDLLTNTKFSCWEPTDDGNWIRINNGKVEFKLADPAHPGDFNYARDINSLKQGEAVDDQFTYSIKLGNGTLSWATVHINIVGANDAAIIGGTATGEVVEAGGVANGDLGTPSIGGTLTVTDVDTGETGFKATGPIVGTYGTFTFDAATGAWNYELNNSDPQTQALTAGQIVTETLTVESLDGTKKDVVVTIKGTNDAPVITSAAQEGAVKEDTTLSISGQVQASDVDTGTVLTYSGNASDAYGSFVVDAATGAWTYTLANGSPAVQALGEGVAHTNSFVVTVSDGQGGTTTQAVTITVTGTNDAATISGETSGTVTEDITLSAISGDLDVADVDFGEAVFQAPDAASLTGAYGAFTFDPASGAWEFTFDNTKAAVQALAAGQTATQSLQVKSFDGTDTETITVTITGTNDKPELSAGGADTGGVTETDGTPEGGAADLTAGGSFAYTDVDTRDVAQVEVALKSVNGGSDANSLAMQVGGLTASISGDDATTNSGSVAWTYAVDPALVESLGEGDTITLVYTLTIDDQNGGKVSRDVTITVTGTNDAATISGDTEGAVVEAGIAAGDAYDEGTLSVSDVDAGENTFAPAEPADLAGTYGDFTFDTGTGKWTYTLNNTLAATQALKGGEEKTETLTVWSLDGTDSQVITVTVTGGNDQATISGETSGNVTEDAAVSVVSGDLDVADVDFGEAVFQAPDSASLTGAYGAFTFDPASGAWSFTLDNSKAAVQALAAGQTATQSLEVKSSDGSDTETINVTITGTNDKPEISSGTQAGAVQEDKVLTATGQVTATDVDTGAVLTYSGNATDIYGSFAVDSATGEWTYTLANGPAVQALAAGETHTHTFTVTVTDDEDATATQDVTITVTGTNDSPVITGDLAATVAEGGSYVLTGLDLGFTDPDDTDALFTVSGVTNGQVLVGGAAVTSFTSAQLAGGLVSFAHNGSETTTASFQVSVEDGNEDASAPVASTFNLTVTPVNDPAAITGQIAGSVTEDAMPNTVSGDLLSTDPDNPTDLWQAASGTTTHGSWAVTAAGVWTFTLNNANSQVQALNAGSSLQDTFTVLTADGTPQVVTVTINGADEPVVVTTPTTAEIVTDAADSNDFDNATGTLYTTLGMSLQGQDTLIGTSGNDGAGGAAEVGIHGGNGVDTLYGLAGNDFLYGDNGVDTVYGGSGNDFLSGGLAADKLYGGSGSDTIHGDDTGDLIVGGFGEDFLSGNGGGDTFSYIDVRDRGDVILDFSNLDGDRLDFSAIDANTTNGSGTNDTFAWGGTAATAYGIWYAYDSATNVTHVYGDTDGNVGTAEFWIDLSGNIDLAAAHAAGNVIL